MNDEQKCTKHEQNSLLMRWRMRGKRFAFIKKLISNEDTFLRVPGSNEDKFVFHLFSHLFIKSSITRPSSVRYHHKEAMKKAALQMSMIFDALQGLQLFFALKGIRSDHE